MLTAVTFSLLGFIIGIWADGFEKLQLVPLLIITPLTFLGGSFYSIDMLPPFWQKVTLFNPVVYLISGFRWSFYGLSDVSVVAEPCDDARVHGDLPCDRRVDIQDGVSAEDLAVAVPPQMARRQTSSLRRSMWIATAASDNAHTASGANASAGTPLMSHSAPLAIAISTAPP